jgi:hypothetical protein
MSINTHTKAAGVFQVVERLPSKCKARSSNASITTPPFPQKRKKENKFLSELLGIRGSSYEAQFWANTLNND